MGLAEIKLHPGLGAEVRGVDFARPLDTATTVELERLWREHHVLLFRGADIADEAQIRFSRAFGELEIHPEADQRSSRHPEIFRVANTEETGHIRSADDPVDVYLKIVEFWHTDSAYRPIPSLGAVLRAVAVPESGGETLFANLFHAWEEMPDELRRRVVGKVGQFSYERIRDFADPGHRKLTEEERAQVPAVTHSLTRRHPERDGRVSLYISPLNMEGIVGMTEAEGFALIDELTAWATQERFVYRHKWHEGDMLMWDNRCTIHQVMPYDRRSQRRTMHRTALVGREPVVPAEAA
jgi:alpha-ketoglutarate-dependent taurine dioxygenase